MITSVVELHMYQAQIPERITDTEIAPKQKVQAGKINESPLQFHIHTYSYVKACQKIAKYFSVLQK